MMDRITLLITGLVCSALAWASWHFYGESITTALMLIVLVGYSVDNFHLRRQVRSLLAERDRREQRERQDRQNMLQRLANSLLAERDKRQQ